MTPAQITFVETFGLFIAAVTLAFCLGLVMQRGKVRKVKSFNALLENWLAEARKHAQTWQDRYDKEQFAHDKDVTQLGAVVETMKARELKFASEYAQKLDGIRGEYKQKFDELHRRVQAAEAKIPKHGPGGRFLPKK